MFAICWLGLIDVLAHVLTIAIARVFMFVLGFLSTSKIRPRIRYHDDRDIMTSGTLVFNFIYLAFCEFLSCTGL